MTGIQHESVTAVVSVTRWVASRVSDRAKPNATSWPVAEMDTVPDSTCRKYGEGFNGTPTTNLRSPQYLLQMMPLARQKYKQHESASLRPNFFEFSDTSAAHKSNHAPHESDK